MKDKKGFTLIEVISVLVILGLLATIVVTQYATTIRESRKRLNDEQKSRLIEVAKNISLNNKNCLETAKNNSEGAKITLDQMKKSGYIANAQLKDLEDNTLLNSCVLVKWDNVYNKFEYEYTENCESAKTCSIVAETEKVIISSFYIEEGNVNYTNKREVSYYIRYSANISAEYCVTLGSEANCNWKKLDMNSTSLSGNLTLNDVENIVHLYIRNSNKNIISSIDDTIILDSEEPVCTWKNPSKTYINNGSSSEITLVCNDVAGIKNTSLSSSSINITNDALASLSDAVVTTSGTTKEFKFMIYGLEGNGDIKLSLKPGIISDNSGNYATTEKMSGTIIVDNIAPTGNITIGDTGAKYTNTENIVLNFSNVSSDIDKICISNTSEGNCNYVNYKPSYNWTLNSTEGAKTVYVSFADKAGNVTNKNVTIHLDRIKPICIANPATSVTHFNLKNESYIDYIINCTDESKIGDNNIDSSMFLLDKQGNSDANISIIETSSSETTIRVKALNGNGKVTVLLKENSIFDAAGNGNNRREITNIIVDNTPPINNLITLNHNSTITHLRNVSVQLDSDIKADGGYYCLKLTDNVNNCNNNDWIRYSNTGSFEVGSNAGEYIVYAYFKDLAGNISPSAVSASIKYDRNAVSCILYKENNSIIITSSNASSLASLPFSNNLIDWNNNNIIPMEEGKKYYFTFIKDNNNEINYCELSISD